MKTCWGSGYVDPRILDPGTSWRWVVSFTSQPAYPREISPRYPLDRRLGGPQNWSGRHEEKNSAPTGTRNSDPSAILPVASRDTDCGRPTINMSQLDQKLTKTPCLITDFMLPLGDIVHPCCIRHTLHSLWSAFFGCFSTLNEFPFFCEVHI
jgi:hypothetical protein